MSWAFLTGFRGHRFSKLGRTHEQKSRKLIYGFKLALLLGIFVGVACGDKKFWDDINGNPDLQTWPYDEHGSIGRAFWRGFLSSTVISAWTLISLAVIFISAYHHDRWLHIWGAVDLALACFACYSLNLQSPHVPHRLEQCKGTRPETWRAVDGYPSIFQTIASVQKKSTSARGICQSFVGLWVAGVAGAFFQFLVAYIGIYSHGDPYSILNPWRPVWYLLCLIVLPPIAFITYGAPYFRFGASRLQKYTNHIRRALNDDFVEWATYTPPKHPFNNPESKLIDILLMEHLLLKIVGNMHHDDLVNLSSTCRSAREAIFPRHDLTMRIPKLMRLCCSKSIRERCYYCNKIICRGCDQYVWSIKPPQCFPGHFHITECAPYCRKCYYTSFSCHPRNYKRPCQGNACSSLKVCGSCVETHGPERFEKRQKRFAQEALAIAHGKLSVERVAGNAAEDIYELHPQRYTYAGNIKRRLPVDGRHCRKCKVELKNGMRWWVCGLCGGECRDPIHPPLVRRRDMWNADVEKGGDVDGVAVGASMPWWKRLFRE